ICATFVVGPTGKCSTYTSSKTFGTNSYIVRCHPAWFPKGEEAELTRATLRFRKSRVHPETTCHLSLMEDTLRISRL
ncbi:hypothetical protein ACQKF6_18520, partial [Bacillus velezensis]